MLKSSSSPRAPVSRRGLDLARVLLVHGDLAPRLALQTILRAGGYAVDCVGTTAEGIDRLDTREYDLVLSVAQPVLSYAKVKQYRPATALVHSSATAPNATRRHRVAVRTENVPNLLAQVAELIGIRAIRRYRFS